MKAHYEIQVRAADGAYLPAVQVLGQDTQSKSAADNAIAGALAAGGAGSTLQSCVIRGVIDIDTTTL